ncbi:hypothetical protein [Caballeronia sp. LZ001]|jgi:hypothetical protein|uniref:hypothetical protein n=1 Tax=Caballeronia sp. LZ001 TaxID=3038553 RepID=UPI0028641E30|nr:hypothetical protein [Caballeronia sp. LZ001]MDR5806476.1 hypothetical protein [Caballeronia sp. LZ001]
MSSFFIEATYLVEAEWPERAIGRFTFEFKEESTDPVQFEKDLIDQATALITEAHEITPDFVCITRIKSVET